MSENLETRIREAVLDLFVGGDYSFPLEPETKMIEAGVCDSLGLVQLAAELERRFPGLKIQDQDITRDNLGTVQSIASFVRAAGAAT